MTRKHFEAIARAIKAQFDEVNALPTNTFNSGRRVAIIATAEALAVEFEGHNANFDPNRFLAACGVQV